MSEINGQGFVEDVVTDGIIEEQKAHSAKMYVSISEDALSAYALIEEPDGEGAHITMEDIRAALEKANVVFGVNEWALQKLAVPTYGEKIQVASGVPAKDGTDGVCTEYFSREIERSQKTRDDGTVDYRELNVVRQVQKGTLICECTEPVPGENGTTVQGKAIKAREAKKAMPLVGENTRTTEDGLRTEAAVAGHLAFRDGRFVVEEVFRVKDIDYEVGNITFLGDVHVGGNMQDGFEIHSGGTVTLCGQVGAVVIKAQDIVIEKGINGTGKAEIRAEKTLKAGFVESCNLYVGEEINVASLINCHVECEGDVIVTGGKGVICGGKITAFGSVKAKVVGNESNMLTTIVMGITPKLLEERKYLESQLSDVTKHIDEIQKNLAYVERLLEDGRPIPPDRIQFCKRARIQLPMTEKKREQIQQNLQEIDVKLYDVNSSTLTANLIYPPTRVSIGSASNNLIEQRSMCRVFKNSDGDVVFGSA